MAAQMVVKLVVWSVAKSVEQWEESAVEHSAETLVAYSAGQTESQYKKLFLSNWHLVQQCIYFLMYRDKNLEVGKSKS
jgi:hypothetical protein